MPRLSLVARLYLAFGLIILLVILQNLFTWNQFRQVNQASAVNEHTLEVIGEAEQLYNALLNIETGERGFALTGNEDFLAPYNTGREAFEELLSGLREQVRGNTEQVERLETLASDYSGFIREGMAPVIELRRSVNTGGALVQDVNERVNRGVGRTYMARMRDTLDAFIAEEERLLAERGSAVDSAILRMNSVMAISPLIILTLAVLVSFAFARMFRTRFRLLRQMAAAMGRGDFSQNVSTRAQDEIGRVVNDFNTMREKLGTLLQGLRSRSEEIGQEGDQLNAVVTSLSRVASEQSESASTISASVEELTVSISRVSENAEEARDTTSRSAELTSEGGRVMDETVDAMKRITKEVREVAEQVDALSEQSDKITSVVGVIANVAEQTNLLALNAAIEAARAGEHGRGFAVVADEVRTLAQRTNESTREIADNVDTIQSGIQRAVKEMDEAVEEVDLGSEQVSAARGVIGEIEQSSSRVVDLVNQISEALKQQSEASNEVAGGVEAIATLANDNNESARSVVNVSERLSQVADSVQREVDGFTLEDRR